MTKTEVIRKNGHWVVTIILTIVTAGGIGHFFNWWNLSVQRDDDYISMYVNCVQKVSELESRMNTLELASGNIPFPYWVKDTEFKVIHVSKEYDRQILAPLGFIHQDIIGTKGEIFGNDFVNIIIENDRDVLKEGKVKAYIEGIPSFKTGTSYKFPIISKFGEVKGVGGIWIPNSSQIKPDK